MNRIPKTVKLLPEGVFRGVLPGVGWALVRLQRTCGGGGHRYDGHVFDGFSFSGKVARIIKDILFAHII